MTFGTTLLLLGSSSLEILVIFVQIFCLCADCVVGSYKPHLSALCLPPPPHIIISCIQIWIYRRQQYVCFKSKCHMVDWLISGMCECTYISVCGRVRMHARTQIHVFMNGLPNTSCKVVAKKFALWGCSFYLLEMTNFFYY
jgi:hypothetical protein